MIYEVTVGERPVKVEVRRDGDGWLVRVDDGPERRVEGGKIGAAEWLLHVGDEKHALGLYVEGDRFDAQVEGHALRGTIVDPRRKALELGKGAGQGDVRTPMPGAVVRVPVQTGQAVQKGQVLVVVEAMKMENEFKAPIAGVVAQVHVQAGQAVDANTLLVSVAVEAG